MKVAVLGASGNAGTEITAELVRRGHEVIAIARKPEAIQVAAGVTAVKGDASDPKALARLIDGVDAVISALHFDIPAETLLSAVKSAGVSRLLVTGGAASLRTASGQILFDVMELPEEWKPGIRAGMEFLNDLRDEKKVDWTFFSPAALIEPGPRTGVFRLGTDQLVVNEAGESRISFADYAIAMVNELEQHRHPRARFTAAY
jgi:hypothetical protein